MTSQAHTRPSSLATGLLWSSGIAVLWIVVALLRPDTTLHLGPLLVPLIPAVVMEPSTQARRATVIAGGIGLGAITILAMTSNLSGPALGPFTNALAESLVFLMIGIGAGLVTTAVRRGGAG